MDNLGQKYIKKPSMNLLFVKFLYMLNVMKNYHYRNKINNS